MTIEFHRIDTPGAFPELEHQELHHRLRGLAWPAAPPEVKQRCLQAVLGAADAGGASAAKAASVADVPAVEDPAPGANGREDESRIGQIERVRRHELTRWEPRTRSVAWPAPRRQPRFATVL